MTSFNGKHSCINGFKSFRHALVVSKCRLKIHLSCNDVMLAIS